MLHRLLPLLLLAACSSSATAPAPVTGTPAALEGTPSRGAAANASSGSAVAFDTWYRVVSTSGPGLRVGSGLRIRAEGYDVASGNLAQTMDGSCASRDGGIECDVPGAPLQVGLVEDGTVRATSGPIELGLVRASDEEASAFAARVDAHAQGQAACRAAADCCMEAETTLGLTCDLNATLGDRTAASCRAALESLRTTLASRASSLPQTCR